MRNPLLALAIAAVPLMPAHALTLEFSVPAEMTGTREARLATYNLPVGAYDGALVPVQVVEGMVDQTAFRLAEPGASTLELLLPLRDQLVKAGFATIYECETAGCGGFDFRYGIEVLPEPEMHVDLGDFRYLAAERTGTAGPESVSLVVSRSADHGFVQITRVSPHQAGPGLAIATGSPLMLPEATLSAPTDGPLMPQPFASDLMPQTASAPSGIAEALDGGGVAALDDLVFPTGTAALAEGNFASLSDLAAWLKANPDMRVTLVGHTDASGGLDANIALSRKRAESARQRLLFVHDIPAGQVSAEGVGYLAPRASNLTDEGRAQNRRVEVMLTSTQ